MRKGEKIKVEIEHKDRSRDRKGWQAARSQARKEKGQRRAHEAERAEKGFR